LLAIQEVYFRDLDAGGDSTDRTRLGELYYAVREGLGFNKTPAEFGAFPVDPYSHSPKHSGARQPGMTGQVKEDILSRFGELGIRVRDGSLSVEPALLKADEFLAVQREMRFLDIDGVWQALAVPHASLAFTWCQVPFVYSLHDSDPALIVSGHDGTDRVIDGLELSADDSLDLFSGRSPRSSEAAIFSPVSAGESASLQQGIDSAVNLHFNSRGLACLWFSAEAYHSWQK
jgi:hypothetical protein